MVNKETWYASYPKEVPISIDYPKVSLAQLLVQSANEFPHHDVDHRRSEARQ